LLPLLGEVGYWTGLVGTVAQVRVHSRLRGKGSSPAKRTDENCIL
jgi:hypothetical protein